MASTGSAIPDQTSGDARILRVSDSVREVTSQDGASLLDVRQGLCFTMNPVGANIWGMLKAGRAVPEIVTQLATDFRLPEEELRSDVLEFIAVLNEKRLLREPQTELKQAPRRTNALLRFRFFQWCRQLWRKGAR